VSAAINAVINHGGEDVRSEFAGSDALAKYKPIKIDTAFKCVNSDMVQLVWRDNGIVSDWVIPGESENLLRVSFERVEIFRVLDEMPLSTENEETPKEGLVSNHFAYEVEGASFYRQQSGAFCDFFPGLKHYRFITGWTCLDVISNKEPQFSLVPYVNGSEPTS
jgi:hypothetical protein